ncbi:MAG: DUF1801 domain-containing protein [Pseudomonadota bacterium]
MSDMKTVPTQNSVEDFIAGVEHEGRRDDAGLLLALLNKVTGAKPVIWGESLIGYGTYAYERADGSQHTYFVTGFSPRKANMVVYLMSGCANHTAKLQKLGRHKHSSSCLYLGRLAKVDLDVLAELIADDIAIMKDRYPSASL